MSLRISQRSLTYGGQNRSWCVEYAGAYNLGVTLDPTLFSAGSFPNTRVPSGQVIAIKTATGLAGPYTAGNTDGLQTPVGYLLNDEEMADFGQATGVPATVPVVTRGSIIPARLPAGSGDSSAVHAALPNIQYRTI